MTRMDALGGPAPAEPAGPDAVRPGRSPSWVPAAFLDPFLRYRPMLFGPSPYLLVAIGLGLGVLAVAQTVVDPEPLRVAAAEIGIPLVAAAGVLYASWWTTSVDRGPQKHASAVLVSLVFMAIAMGTVAVVVLSQLPSDAAGFDWPFAVSTTLSVGALVGTPTGFVLDEVVARQEALEAEYRETKRLNQRLRVVNRVMRHNIRNELTVALGGIDIAGSHLDNPEARAWAERSRAALERLHDHAEKVVKIDSLEQSKDDRMAVDVVGYIKGYLQAQVFGSERVSIETDLPERAEVTAHPLVGTVILEVIENAVEHNEAPDLRVSVRVLEADGEVQIEVADSGGGMPTAELEALERGAEAPLDHSEGVGLWLAKWVTEASGGGLTFEARDPAGTVVRLRLPAAG